MTARPRSRSSLRRVLSLAALLLLAVGGCEPSGERQGGESATTKAGSGSAEAPPKASPADPKTIAFDTHAKTLSATLLNPYGSRDLALGDVAGAVWGLERPRGEPPAKILERLCAAVAEADCAELSPELRYFALLRATLEALAVAARAQGQEPQATALETWAARTGEMVAQGLPVTAPRAAEPLADLQGDPVLVVRAGEDGAASLDVLVGPAVVRTIDDVLAPENAARSALLDALERGDLFTATGLVAPAGAAVEKQPGTPLRLLLAADAPVGAALELVRLAYAERKLQQVELVVRSEQYGTLSGLALNVVNASVRGSDHGVQLGTEQITWRASKDGGSAEARDEEIEGVSWSGLERLSEIARLPPGQLVLYVEVSGEVTGQQLADALSALRARCGSDNVLCPTLQLALALKSTGEEPK